MQLFDVYPLYDIEPSKGLGAKLWDTNGKEYLDFYGGHAVISIGHSHPHYISRVGGQLQNLGFYSNSVKNGLQTELTNLLGTTTGYADYSLFLCNSGAEANENALKLASFHTGRSKVIAFAKAFHGRTSGAVACTDNKAISSPFNANHNVEFLPWNDISAAEKALAKKDVAAVIIEGIQGVGGIVVPNKDFLQRLSSLCKSHGTALILDEIQSGYGRTGKFFAHQHFNIKPDIITTAKGMGNGFPIGGVLISPEFQASYGLLGTTFGGNHLACAAALAVLEVINSENLISNAATVGAYLLQRASTIDGVKEVRGIGLMVGLELENPMAETRKKLLFEHGILTGYSGTHTIRLLPPLNVTTTDVDKVLNALAMTISHN